MLSYADLPHLNAALNGMSALAAAIGYLGIRGKNRRLHQACMITAVILSALFLASYLTYHAQAGSVRLQKQGWVRPVYFAILISHSTLAAAVVPLVALSLGHALAHRFAQHRRWARWTLPVWVYVSISGIVVYWILYW